MIYDFEVDEVRNYVANGLVSSNSASISYRKVWDYFRKGNPDIKLLGITATPNRSDNLTLSCVAEHCCFNMGIREGVDTGWLVPVHQKYVVVEGLDFTNCRTQKNEFGEKDLNAQDLEDAMLGGKIEEGMSEEEQLEIQKKRERIFHKVAATTVKEAQGKSGIVFCVSVAHATKMTEIFRRYPEVTAACVFGHTPDEERNDTIASFRRGEIQFLCLVGIGTEGFNAPIAQLIIMARPTKSLLLYQQMIGRATRPVEGLVDKYSTPDERKEAIGNSTKSNCTILDFVGNSGKHKLISTADVFAGDMPKEFIDAAIEEMTETGNTEDIRIVAWRKKDEREEEVRRQEEEERKKQEERRKRAEALAEAKRSQLRAEPKYRTEDVDPYDATDVRVERAQPAFRGGANDAMVGLLVRLGITKEKAMTWSRAQAGAVINKLKSQVGADFIMRFGKHQGITLENIPASYLRWAVKNIKDQEVQENFEVYRQEIRAGKRDKRYD